MKFVKIFLVGHRVMAIMLSYGQAWYVDHVSLVTDLKVIWITIMKVLKRADINEAGQATMEAYNGNN